MGFNDGSHQFVFDKQLMFAVGLALEAGLLLHRIIWTVTGRRRLLQQLQVFHKDERFEYRPVVRKSNLLNHQPLPSSEFEGCSLSAKVRPSAVPFRVWSCRKIVNPWQRGIPGDDWHHTSCCHEHALHVDAAVFIPQDVHHRLSSYATFSE